MSKIWSPTRPLCSPVVFGPGARTVTRRSTGRLLIPVMPTPLAGLGSGTARLTDRILLTPGNLAVTASIRRQVYRPPARIERGDGGRAMTAGTSGQAPPPALLDDAERMSVDELRELQLQRLQWSQIGRA